MATCSAVTSRCDDVECVSWFIKIMLAVFPLYLGYQVPAILVRHIT
jgi:hypothetical protein